jgi:hypothetical protein
MEAFIFAAPMFDGDIELAGRMGELIADARIKARELEHNEFI